MLTLSPYICPMASPLPTAKQSVSLASSSGRGSSDQVRVSRIRRDPPPVPDEKVVAERDERDARMVIIGIVTFALAIVVIGVALMSYAGWSPRQYQLDV